MLRINAMLSEDVVERLDRIARENKKSRSKLLNEAAKIFITQYNELQAEKERRERIINAITVQDRLRKKSGKWDGTAEIRKWREKR